MARFNIVRLSPNKYGIEMNANGAYYSENVLGDRIFSISPAKETYEAGYFDYSPFFDCSDLIPGKSDSFNNILVKKSSIFLLDGDGNYTCHLKGELRRREPDYTNEAGFTHYAKVAPDNQVYDYINPDHTNSPEIPRTDRELVLNKPLSAEAAAILNTPVGVVEDEVFYATDDYIDFDPTVPQNYTNYSVLKRFSFHYNAVFGFQVLENDASGEFYGYMIGNVVYLYPSERTLINSSLKTEIYNDLFKIKDGVKGSYIEVGYKIVLDDVMAAQIIMPEADSLVHAPSNQKNVKNTIRRGEVGIEGLNCEEIYVNLMEPTARIPGTLIPYPRAKRDGESIEHYEDWLEVHFADFGIKVDRKQTPRDSYPHEILLDEKGELVYSAYYRELTGRIAPSDSKLVEDILECYPGTDILTYYGYGLRLDREYNELSTQHKIDHLVTYIPYLQNIANKRPDQAEFIARCLRGEDGVEAMIDRLQEALMNEKQAAYFSSKK